MKVDGANKEIITNFNFQEAVSLRSKIIFHTSKYFCMAKLMSYMYMKIIKKKNYVNNMFSMNTLIEPAAAESVTS